MRSQAAPLSGIGPKLICFVTKQRLGAQVTVHVALSLGAQDLLLVLRMKTTHSLTAVYSTVYLSLIIQCLLDISHKLQSLFKFNLYHLFCVGTHSS